MPLGVNDYDTGRIQERNAAASDRGQVVSPGLETTGLRLHFDAGNYASSPGSASRWLNLAGTTNYTTTATWNQGGYLVFNGTTGEAYSADSSSYPNINNQNFSVSGWFRTSTASGKKIFGFENVNSGTAGVNWDKHLYIDTIGKLIWGVYVGGVASVSSSATYIDNKWYNFAVVYNASGSTSQFYVNGVSIGTLAGKSTDGGIYLRIGSYKISGTWPNNGGDGYFPGDIANFMFYLDTVLTPTQVLKNFNAMRARFGV